MDPAIQVISPAATAAPGVPWLSEYLKLGGGSCADVVGFHFYVSPQPPEAMLGLILRVQGVMAENGAANKPLWNTETGWWIENRLTKVLPRGNGSFSKVLTSQEASAYVARSYILNWAAGVSRFYWYSWDSEVEGLTEADGKTLKSSATAYAQVERWLVGWRMTSCDSDANATWVCEVSRGANAPAVAGKEIHEWIAWNPDRSIAFKIPAVWHLQQIADLSGHHASTAAHAIVTIGPAPLLFETVSR